MNIWYMRDNHTFRKLSDDLGEAKEMIRQEFASGHSYGMVATKEVAVEHCHARGDLEMFLIDLELYYERVREALNSGPASFGL